MANQKEIPAHVLFMDVVGYSLRPVDEQPLVVHFLNDAVKYAATEHKPPVGREDKVVYLPTGDGMAIAFLDPDHKDDDEQDVFVEHPIEWAFRIREYLEEPANRPAEIKAPVVLRMGINSERVTPVTDPNGHQNVSGPGINMAQRAMDCGTEDWQVLAIHDYERMLLRKGSRKARWQKFFSGGPVPTMVKHSQSISLYNLYGTHPERGSILGYPSAPHPKPRPDAVPSELKEAIIVANVLGDEFRANPEDAGRKALLAGLSWAFRERLRAVRDLNPIEAPHVWDHVKDLLKNNFATPKHTSMELISLVTPDAWEKPEWRRYQALIHEITAYDNSCARRLHVIRDNALAQKSCLAQLVPLMAAEFMCSVRPRVLAIAQEKLTRIGGTEDSPLQHFSVPVLLDQRFLILDAGTYYAPGARYNFVFSDIQLFSSATTFQLYHAGDRDARFIYDELRANFMRGWHLRGEDDGARIYKWVDIAELVNKVLTDAELEECLGQVVNYLPKKSAKDLEKNPSWRKEVMKMCDENYGEPSDSRSRETLLVEEMRELIRPRS